jgi:hypothetical protein
MTNEKWHDATVHGSAYEEQVSETGEYRHRRLSIGPARYYDDWTPGHAPGAGERWSEPTSDDVAAALKANPMRMMCSLRCLSCGYDWRQPAAMGHCPICHGENIEKYDQQPNMLPRA